MGRPSVRRWPRHPARALAGDALPVVEKFTEGSRLPDSCSSLPLGHEREFDVRHPASRPARRRTETLDHRPVLRATDVRRASAALTTAPTSSPASELVLDAGGVRRCAAIFGLSLSADQATALSNSPLSLPDLLPSVIASLSVDEIEDQDDPVAYLLEESEHQLEVRLRGSKRLSRSTARCASPIPADAHVAHARPRLARLRPATGPRGAGPPRATRAGGIRRAVPHGPRAAEVAARRASAEASGARSRTELLGRPLLRRPRRAVRSHRPLC